MFAQSLYFCVLFFVDHWLSFRPFSSGSCPSSVFDLRPHYKINNMISCIVSECKDKLPNCFAFGKDSCKPPYEKWANDYCPNTCGFCVGKYNVICFILTSMYEHKSRQPTFWHNLWIVLFAVPFARDIINSRSDKSRETIICVNYTFYKGPTTPEPPCENQRADCESYQKTVCTDQRYAQWANDNCRYYCRLCSGNLEWYYYA